MPEIWGSWPLWTPSYGYNYVVNPPTNNRHWQAGLLHVSDTNGRWFELRELVGPNDVITVAVKNVDRARRRIGLRLVRAHSLERTRFV